MSADIRDVETLLEERGEFLSEWERNFLGSLQDWQGDFTDRQAEILENICGKYGV